MCLPWFHKRCSVLTTEVFNKFSRDWNKTKNHSSLWRTELVVNDQFGFCRGKSTTENLTIYQAALLEALEGGKHRLFQDVWQPTFVILIDKFAAGRFRDRLMLWIKSFLLNWTQAVHIEGYASKVFDINDSESSALQTDLNSLWHCTQINQFVS